jgi:transcriptional regulator with XRE-family HTH domain
MKVINELSTNVEVLETLRDQVRVLRTSRGITQVQLSRKTGLSLATIRKYETTGISSLENFVKIIRVLNKVSALGKLFESIPSSIAELKANATGNLTASGTLSVIKKRARVRGV